MVYLDICPAGLRPRPTPLAAPNPRLDPGPRPSRKLKSFFWDKLPENRLQKTFWADHPPSYASLRTDEVWAFSRCIRPHTHPLLEPTTVQHATLMGSMSQL